MLTRKSKRKKRREKPKTGANQRQMQLNDSYVYYVFVKLILDIPFGFYTFLDILLQLNSLLRYISCKYACLFKFIILSQTNMDGNF